MLYRQHTITGSGYVVPDSQIKQEEEQEEEPEMNGSGLWS